MTFNLSSFRRCGLYLLCAFCIALTGCNSGGPLSRISQDNLDKVQNDMSSAQVKAILGDPTDSQSQPIPIVGGTKTTYTYVDNQNHITIILKNDQVQSKEGTFSSPTP
jgi:hypothetical protein